MNMQEFKAWFEGFTESMEGVPSKKAWARIQGRVKEITDAPTTVTVFRDRYWPSYYVPWYGTYGLTPHLGQNQMQNSLLSMQDYQASGIQYLTSNQGCLSSMQGTTPDYNAKDAFQALGRADADNLN